MHWKLELLDRTHLGKGHAGLNSSVQASERLDRRCVTKVQYQNSAEKPHTGVQSKPESVAQEHDG